MAVFRVAVVSENLSVTGHPHGGDINKLTASIMTGTDCQDTKDFVKAANIHGSQAYLRGCYEQLKSVPDLDFESIDYGFRWENSFKTYWAWASDGIRAGLVIGMIVGGIIAMVLLVFCCGAMCG